MWMNVDEIMKALGVSRATVYRLAKTGKIPRYRIGGQWKFKEEEIRKWLENGGNPIEHK